MIQKGISRHNSLAFYVENESEKKRGKRRMVLDYRTLNKNCEFDSYKIPDKNNLISFIENRKIFSKFDCKSGFWQIKMHPDSISWTSFSVPQGKYEWLVMPFGYKNAPQVFQLRIDGIFRKYSKFALYTLTMY